MSHEAKTIPVQTTTPTPTPRHAAEKPITAWERFSFSCIRAFLRLHLAVWGLHGMYVSSRFFGTLEYLVDYKRRGRVKRMLQAIRGDRLTGKALRRTVREHFIRQRCDKVFYLIFDMLPDDAIRSRFSIVNQQLLDDGLARGKGVYVMLCHHGAHHVIGMLMSSFGYPASGIRAPNEGALRRFIQETWERKHPDWPRLKMLIAGEFVRPVYRLFQSNHVLGSALDAARLRDAHLKTVPITLLGQKREMLTGTLQIAIRCQAVVLQGFIISADDFNYRLELIGPMTDPDSREESPELLTAIMQRYADSIAEYVSRDPEVVKGA